MADNEHLAAMYILLKKEIGIPYQYDTATLAMLYQRMEDDLRGLSKSYTIEEVFTFIRHKE